MKHKLKLIHILIHRSSFWYIYQDCQSKREFQSYLRETPLGYIITLWILYRLSEGGVLQLEIKQKKPEERGSRLWQVRHMNKPLFSFTCDLRMKFMKTFEEHLEQWLEKQTFIRTKPPAGKKPE